MLLVAAVLLLMAGADDVDLCVKGEAQDARAEACARLAAGNGDAHIQAVALINRAEALRRLGKLDEALADADRSVSLEPGLVGAHGKRGVIHFARKDMDKAIADFTAEMKLDPSDLNALVNRAVAHFEKDENGLAIADMTAAIKASPKLPMLYSHRAAMYLDSGDVEHAVADYKAVLRLDPGDAKAAAQLKDLGQ